MNNNEHMKAVAERNKNDEREAFFRYLIACGWKLTDVEQMWEYAIKLRGEERMECR